MEKLTRAAKFSSLRDQINNDKETGLNSQDLSPFKDRLNNVQEMLNPNQNSQINTNWTPFGDQQPAQGYQLYGQQPAQPQTYVQPEVTQAQPAQGYQLYGQQPAQPQQVNNSSFYNDFMNTPVTNNTVNNDFSAMFDNVANNNSNFVQQQRETYLNQTFSDVNMHNLANGQPTLNQIVNDTVNEVRHNQEVYQNPVNNTTSFAAYKQEPVMDNTYAFNPNQQLDADAYNKPIQNMSDEQFSNTVSMEITKIMDSMNTPVSNNANPFAQPAQQVYTQPVAQPQVEQTQTFVQPEPIAQPQVIVEQPKVQEPQVEIKNISEMDNSKEAMSETIPFVVSANDEDVIEEDEEEGSNTVLNIILIVLIIVLIAVLGLIVFYILKTKGIL